jgi:chemotaxis protein MotB
MSKDPFSKLQSSLSLEELLAQPNTRNSQNWLLTYLDVFVLIVMLVITLITVSDINTQQQVIAIKPKPQPKCPVVEAPKVISCPPGIVTETKPEQQLPAIIEHKADKVDINIAPEESHIDIPELKSTENKVATENITTPPIEPVVVKPPVDENKLQQQLTKTINEFGLNKSVNIKVTQGYAQLEIQDNVLFKSSESKLTSSGEAVIKRLIPMLKQAVGLILIEGHTDNIPIKTGQFPSNWELGSSRATSVLHYLVSQSLESTRLRAISYADTMPIADNSTPDGREKNRRVNILIKFPEP